ncbi:MAG TPA: hypothetical protein PKA39_02470 [Ignavibacteria bacterium]|nr:hypothetical protein [Ignavibacteria bacterium]
MKTVADYNFDSLFTPQDKEIILASYDGGQVKVIDIIKLLIVNRDFARMQLTEQTINGMINSAAENPILNRKAKDMNFEKDDEYAASIADYENGLLVFRVDQDELWSKVKVSETDITGYYESNKSKYTKTDSTGKQVNKTIDEVRAEISNELQQQKYKDSEKAYLEALRQKYPVVIHEEILTEAFMD